jgi:hypothetical protein
MKSTRESPHPFLALLLMAANAWSGLTACGKEAIAPPALPPPVELVIGEPAPPPPPSAKPSPTARAAPVTPPLVREPEPESASEPLPRTWTAPIVPGLGFADALRKGRAARDAFARLPLPPPNAKEASLKAWFGQAQTLVDQASRMYAGAFNAKDAPRDGRVDAIAEAAELDMTMARTLDDQNLGSMPAAWRSDPAVMGTFEDVEVGPTRRWRAEARALTRQCIETARETNVVTAAARRCATLRTGAPTKVVQVTADAGAGCACHPGDPLCSASLGGWCATPPP